MFEKDLFLEYLSSPEGINKIILVIIFIAIINAIFITYSVRKTYGMAKEIREKLKVQQAKIDKLSPTKK
tara:strand:- start:741 stop:947 length:207 start_codon:yes stop_codon:yes gene_type:complete